MYYAAKVCIIFCPAKFFEEHFRKRYALDEEGMYCTE
jgi:hypothetical protein